MNDRQLRPMPLLGSKELPHVGILVIPTLFVVIACMLVSPGRAEPYFAQREGYKCSVCHVNRTGGGMRNAFGYQYGITHLNVFATSPEDEVKSEANPSATDGWIGRRRIDPNLTDYLAVGANLRFTNTTSFAEQVHNTFEIPEANLYLRLRALDHLTAYVDLSVAEGSTEARETFVMLDEWGGLSLKAGYLLLPYGLRIWGEEEFIRRETGFNYASPDLGAELGFERGPFSAYVAVSNGAGGGQDSDVDKQVSGLTELSFKVARIGLSGSYNRTRKQSVLFGGAYLGLTLGRLALLVEADLIRTTFTEADAVVSGLVGYGEANFLLMRGLNLQMGYGYHDPALDVEENQRMHFYGGIEFFPIPSVATRLRYDIRQSVPQDEIGNADILLSELHFFF